MTITQAQIEAGARALCRSDQLSPDALVTNFTAFRGEPLWKTYAVKAKAALVASEHAAWRPIEEVIETTADAILDDTNWSTQIRYGAKMLRDALLARFRPLPTPGEPDEHNH